MGHQYSHAPGRPILHRRLILSQTSAGNSCKSSYVTITSLLRSVPLFGWEPFLRPGLRMQRRAERKGPSRLAVAITVPLAPLFAGHALTGLSTARRSSRSGRISLDALEGASLVENRPGDTGELVGERDRQHIAVQALLCRLDP